MCRMSLTRLLSIRYSKRKREELKLRDLKIKVCLKISCRKAMFSILENLGLRPYHIHSTHITQKGGRM